MNCVDNGDSKRFDIIINNINKWHIIILSNQREKMRLKKIIENVINRCYALNCRLTDFYFLSDIFFNLSLFLTKNNFKLKTFGFYNLIDNLAVNISKVQYAETYPSSMLIYILVETRLKSFDVTVWAVCYRRQYIWLFDSGIRDAFAN